MSNVVKYDPSGIVTNMVTEYLPSVNTPDYSALPNVLINPSLSGVSGVDLKYWKVDTGSVVEMSSGEKTIIDDSLKIWIPVDIPIQLRSLDSGVTEVIANGRVALEIQDSGTGFGISSLIWYLGQPDKVRVTFYFILKSSGSGSNVRIASQLKAQGDGEDSSAVYSSGAFSVVSIDHDNPGDIFTGSVELDTSIIDSGDSVSIGVGRDGNNEMGSGDYDDATVPIQILQFKVEARV